MDQCIPPSLKSTQSLISLSSINDETTTFKIPVEHKELFSNFGIVINKIRSISRRATIFEGDYDSSFNIANISKLSDQVLAKAISIQSKRFAVKFINLMAHETDQKTEIMKSIENQKKVMFSCCHNGVVDIHLFVSFNNSLFYFFMELADSDLRTYFKNNKKDKRKIEESRCKVWIKSLSETLLYLHEQQITHGNIKMRNILMFGAGRDQGDPSLKLSDFFKSETHGPSVSIPIGKVKSTDALHFEDSCDSDVLDLYFVFQRILDQTDFKQSDTYDEASAIVRQLITLEGDSRTLIKNMLQQNFRN